MQMKEEDERRCIRIPVRSLVEFVFQGGDIDNRRTGGAEKEAMQAGSRIHRKIQRSMGEGYRSEVHLVHIVDEGEFSIAVEGRADGIFQEDGRTVIDEIKGVYMDLDRLEEPVYVHLAQAMCYAYIYSTDRGLDRADVQITYCSLDTEEIKRFRKEYGAEELTAWFQGLIREYVKWARYLYEHGIRRDESLRALDFPYPYRPGQKELARSVYRCIVRKKNLFIQAPTGVGKTLSVLYPALKAMGEGMAEKIFYLTARTIGRSVAEETLSVLREKGMYANSVTITAREKLCVLPSPACNPDDCPRARGHFDRVAGAVYDLICGESLIDRETILDYAERYQVCPFEFCLDISSWVDIVICDYNYVFDPNVRLKRYFSEGNSGKYLFLADEAHNLVPRAREMYSAALIKEDVLAAKRILAGRNRKLVKLLERLNRLLLEMKRESAEYLVRDGVGAVEAAARSLYAELEPFMDENRQFEGREELLDFYFELRSFLMVLDRLDDSYSVYTRFLEDGRFMLRLFCINPSGNLRECLEKGRSTVFFSATLLPVNYYKELLSGNLEDYAVYAESPFPRENRLLLIGGDVSSRYSRRTRREYEKIAEYIHAAVAARKGNYMIFFPSYAYLEQVFGIWTEKYAEVGGPITVVCQDSRMSEEQKEEFLRLFEEERPDTLAAFCVMGGIFAEGIDLKNERLIGAVVVGTGLPMVCAEQEILMSYFREKGKNGFDYAYRYPGMNKVQQAAGRVIRTMEDRGIILLLDDRFLHEEYQTVFPREWWPFETVDRRNVGGIIERFWKE